MVQKRKARREAESTVFLVGRSNSKTEEEAMLTSLSAHLDRSLCNCRSCCWCRLIFFLPKDTPYISCFLLHPKYASLGRELMKYRIIRYNFPMFESAPFLLSSLCTFWKAQSVQKRWKESKESGWYSCSFRCICNLYYPYPGELIFTTVHWWYITVSKLLSGHMGLV